MEKQSEVPDFDNLGGVEGKGVDLQKYDKEKTIVELVQVKQVKSNFTVEAEDGTKPLQWVMQVSSKVLVTLGEGEDAIEFRASELFNMIQDEEGTLEGYPIADKSNLVKFLADLKINAEGLTMNQLIEKIKGKEVLIKAYEKEKEGTKRTFLKFLY